MKKLGFTLAEVLLTMTLVGAIAAMTVPSLLYTRIKSEYSTKLSKFYSRVEDAIGEMQLEKGSFKDLKISENFYRDYIDPYLGHQYIKENSYYLIDGSKITDLNKGSDCFKLSFIPNGDRSRERERDCVDKYFFAFCFTDAAREANFGSEDIFFGPDNSPRGDNCTKILHKNKWKYNANYNHKF